MDLPVNPPVAPMLAKPVEAIPDGDYVFEPKWDGFRSIVFRDGDEVEIGSRNERPMTRYFPEVVAGILAELPERCVIDGEIVVPDASGQRLDFEALQLRIHPAASRVGLLAEQTPAHFIAFDLLALGSEDYMERPFAERRAALANALAGAGSRVHLTLATTDRSVAAGWFRQFEGAGLDGLIAKPSAGLYEPDKRVMKKIKHERTADCVVAGYRVHKSGPDRIGSLLLGLYTDGGRLASVGVVGALPMEQRISLFAELQPLVTGFEGHPWDWGAHAAGQRTPRAAMASRWNADKDLSFVPLRPERILEVRYDHMEGPRFRHTAQFVRWRPDREPRSCTYAQLEEPVGFDLAEILRGRSGGSPSGELARGRAVAEPKKVLELAGHEVAISNPSKVFFPRAGVTKLDMVRYYLSVAGGALAGRRPADGAEAVRERGRGRGVLPEARSGEAAGLYRYRGAALPLRPHRGRSGDHRPGRPGLGDQPRLHRPEPAPGARRGPGSPGRAAGRPGPGARRGMAADQGRGHGRGRVLADFGLTGWPKTSGSRGMHIYARIEPRWPFGEVRRAAVAVAREIERRTPDLATSKWWKEERHGVFVDYNQNAKDRTIASAYSIRPVPDARVSAPLTWDEVPACDPASYTIFTMGDRFAAIGDPWAGMDEAAGSLKKHKTQLKPKQVSSNIKL